MKEAYLVKAFTNDPSLGNPAGVILDAEYLDDRTMLATIAAYLEFAESAFVQPSDKADFRIRFLHQSGKIR